MENKIVKIVKDSVKLILVTAFLFVLYKLGYYVGKTAFENFNI